MAKQWTDLAINIKGSEALADQILASLIGSVHGNAVTERRKARS